MNKILFFLLILFLPNSLVAQFDVTEVSGTYQYKVSKTTYETIKLNTDFTFEYSSGDVIPQRTIGNWKFLSNGKIYLVSPEGKLNFKVTEKQKDRNGNILIQIMDDFQVVDPGIIVEFEYLGSENQCITDISGICEIPETDVFKLTKNKDYKGVYKIKNKENNLFFVEIGPPDEPFVEYTFLFKAGQLFQIYRDGDIDEDGFKKISEKKSKKIFPTN